jgi:transcriptional regulator with XRE-family HTH domain
MAEQPALGFAGLLRQLRAEALLTQEELAQAAGLSPRSVSDLERGINRTARKDTAVLLAGALGLAEPVRGVFLAAALGRVPAAQVLAAMGGQPGGAAEAPSPGAGQAWTGCPYLGLTPFQERDARVFYGRGELVTRLVRQLAGRLDGTGILLVAGDSGAGKSSLLRAGLMPQLVAGALGPGSHRWPGRVIRPTDNPLRELAMHLADLAGADPLSVYQSLSAAPDQAPMLIEHAVRTVVGQDPGPGSAAGSRAVASAPPRLVLVIDQFEELFTAGENAGAGRAERQAFIAALHAAATIPVGPRRVPSALVIAAVRSDFLDRLIAYPPLKAALDAGPFTIGPMSEAELRLAITGPAAEAGLVVEPALVESVLAELRDGVPGGLGSGVLPLMSQTMAATWEHREGDSLTLRVYRRAGGAAGAVSRTARAAYGVLTEARKEAARLVFIQLTVIDSDGQLTRRRCTRTDLRFPGTQTAADIDAVIDVFSAHRLLVLGRDWVEIAHDLLLQAWEQLRGWLGGDQPDRVLYGQIITDAQTWESNGRNASYLYWPGRLAIIDAATARWQAAPARYPPLSVTSTAFLRAGHVAARRATWRRRGARAGLALAVIAITVAGIAVSDAVRSARAHAIALSRLLATESLAMAPSDPVTAGRLAVAAWHVFPTDQARSAMTTVLIERHQDAILRGDRSRHGVKQVVFGPAGQPLAAVYGDGQVRLWIPGTNQAIGAPLPADTGPGSGVTGVAFSPDGSLLATADADGEVRLWNPATGRPAAAPIPAGTGSGVTAVAFSPDGSLLATADADGQVRLWNPATGRPAAAPVRAGTGSGVTAVAFSTDGKLLAAAYGDGYVRLWNPVTGQAVGALLADAGSGAGVTGLAFSPDGRLLATGNKHGAVRVWSLVVGQVPRVPVATFTASGSGVTRVAFSPDSKLLATGDQYGIARIWNLTGQEVGVPLPADTGPGGRVNGVAFSPDGKLLATADADGTVRTWPLSLFENPYASLCAEVGPPTQADWAQYAPGEPRPTVCG